jgi:hypothetical protein
MATMSRGSSASRSGDCGCGGSSRSAGGSGWSVGSRGSTGAFAFGTLERPRYYPRQLMTPDDLNLEAEYFRDKLRRHNLFLHGWGVVCGALVCTVAQRKNGTANQDYARRRSELKGEVTEDKESGATEPWMVRVQPGYIIGPYGDEIVIDQAVEVSLQGDGAGVCGSDAGEDDADPWCAEVYVARRDGPIYVAVKYRECTTRPVPSSPGGCDCAEEPCEYSRYRDGFEIGFLDCCPDSHQAPDKQDAYVNARAGRNPTCPECPESPWVVLAKVEVDGNGIVQVIDNCDCRRVMRTTRDQWTVCTGSDCDTAEKPAAEGIGEVDKGAVIAGRADAKPAPATKPTKPSGD